jgi:hypothetical protein
VTDVDNVKGPEFADVVVLDAVEAGVLPPG